MVSGSLEIVKRERKGKVEAYCVRFLPQLHKPISSTVQQALLHLNEGYEDQPLWLHNFAVLMNVHPDYLGRKFKQEVGIKFHDYLLLKRMEKASSLLRNSGKNVKEISYELGFSSPAVFSKVFKRFIGYSPRKYRSTTGRTTKYKIQKVGF
jgi:two-component system response regulator YesN